MIASIHGLLKTKKDNWALIETGGLGYKVFIPVPILENLQIGTEVYLYIYHHISEQSQALFGFSSINEQEFFEMLLGISGIGPKVALSALSAASVEEIQSAVLDDNPEILTAISGIGKKTAERIVLELRNKLTVGDVRQPGIVSLDIGTHFDAFEALKRLGYNAVEARAALKMVPQSVRDPEDKVKQALKILSKK